MLINNSVFIINQYVDELDIKLDKKEFEFQFSSHPEYPNLIALSDTLNFFNIPNSAMKVDKSEIDLLPDLIIAKLIKKNKSTFSYIKREGDIYKCKINEEETLELNKDELSKLWGNIIFLVEKNDIQETKSKNKLPYYLFSIVLVLFLIVIYFSVKKDVKYLVFYILSFIGMILSLSTFKEIFKTKNKILDKFCNISTSTNCDTVFNSSKWALLKKIGFRDLSVVFFVTQFFSLVLIGFWSAFEYYFSIQIILLYFSIPIIILSLYYQKFVEKKWCPICLFIALILILEVAYLVCLHRLNIGNFEFEFFVFYSLILSVTISVLYLFKLFSKEFIRLKDEEVQANRFRRNYPIFKNTLAISKKYNLPETLLDFGREDASLHITIISSPFCGHCESPHFMLKSLLDKYKNKLKVSVIFNADPKNSELKKVCGALINTAVKSNDSYYIAMEEWFKDNNSSEFLKNYKHENLDIENSLIIQHSWCVENNLSFTPCLFINGFLYPNSYRIKDLPFYIDEMLDDNSIINNRRKPKSL